MRNALRLLWLVPTLAIEILVDLYTTRKSVRRDTR